MIKSYLKIAWRSLFKNRIYSSINIIGLSVGIASFVLILLYLNHEMSYDKWHPSLSKVYKLGMLGENGIEMDGATPAPLGQFLKTNYPKVEAATTLAGGGSYEIIVAANDKKIFQNGLVEVDSSFFNVFPYTLKIGDTSTALNTPNAAIISEEVSRKFFGNDNPIGKTIKLYNALDLVITGVLQDINKPSSLQTHILFRSPYEKSNFHWNNYSYETYIKLQNSETIEAVENDINPIYYENRIKKDSTSFETYLSQATATTLFAERLTEIHNFPKSGGGNFKTVMILLGLAFLLLLAGAINFSNLSVATSIKRAREVGVRKVLGSSRKQLFWQFMSESAILSFLSLFIAILLLALLVPGFKREFNINFPLFEFSNTSIYLQLLLCMVGIILLSGLYPSTFLSRFNTTKVLKGDYSQGKKGNGLRNVLLVIQFSLSAFFIFAALVVSKQMNFMQSKDKGFNSEQVMRITIQQKTGEAGFDVVKNKLASIPGVQYVSKTTTVPGDEYIDTSASLYRIEGKDIRMTTVKVSKDYFKTLDASILQGRDFNESFADNNTRSVVLNETAAKLAGITEPIGKAIHYPYCDTFQAQVIGVVKDFSVQTLSNSIRPVAYSIGNKACGYMWGGALLVKINSGNTKQTINAIETVWASIEPDVPIRYSFLDENFQKLYNEYNRLQKIISFFTIVAVIIAAMGLFALTAFLIKEKTREIGIRKILGADVTHISLLVSKNFLLLIIIAAFIALPVGWWAAQKWLQTFAYRVHLNWLVFAIAISAIMIVSLITMGIQTIKAAKANPIKSLRTE